nr:hypothetical protein [Tanacetum cinerariifolium]
ESFDLIPRTPEESDEESNDEEEQDLRLSADDQSIVQTSQHPEWFSLPRRPPSSDRAWNTTLPAAQGDAQSWI